MNKDIYDKKKVYWNKIVLIYFDIIFRAQLDLLPTEMEEYEEWKKTFNIQKYTSEILKLLEKNEPIRKYQSEIVPQKMSQDDFWCKYFFHFNLYIKENGIYLLFNKYFLYFVCFVLFYCINIYSLHE